MQIIQIVRRHPGRSYWCHKALLVWDVPVEQIESVQKVLAQVNLIEAELGRSNEEKWEAEIVDIPLG